MWRFWIAGGDDDETLQQREERANVAISFAMILYGFLIISAAIDDARRGPDDAYEYVLIWSVSFLSVLFFGIFAWLKFRYANCLVSDSLYKDGICSLIRTALSLALLLNTTVVLRSPGLWWIHALTTSLAGVTALGLGTRAIYTASFVQEIPIFTLGWWTMSGTCASNDGCAQGGVEVISLGEDTDPDVEDARLIRLSA